MFCTACATYNQLSPERCSNCGSSLPRLRDRNASEPVDGHSWRRWAIGGLPLLFLTLVLLGAGGRELAERRELRSHVSRGEQLLAIGDLLGARNAFAEADGYQQAGKRLAEVNALIEPYALDYQQALDAYDAGDYDRAIGLLRSVLVELPEYPEALALLEQVREDRIVALQREADEAERALDWLGAERALTAILRERPDDEQAAARLNEIRASFAPVVYSRMGAIYTGSPDGTSEHVVLEGMSPSWPMWNPSRTQIAFVNYPPDRRTVDGDLYVVNADGSGLRLLSSSMIPFSWPIWSPDGSKIAYTSAASFNIDSGQGFIAIQVADVATGEITQLTDREYDFAASPAWSPDGQRLAFVERIFQTANGSTDFIGGDVYVIDLRTKAVTNVSRDLLQDERAVSWSPAGDELAIVTRPSDWSTEQSGGIYILNLETDTLLQVPTTSWRPGYPTWSPDGQRLAFIEGNDVIRIWSAAGVEWVRLATDVQQNLGWSPDGQSIFAPAATLVEPSYIVPVGSEFGTRTHVEITFDTGNGPSGPPVWGARTSETPPVNPGGTGLDPVSRR